MKVSTQVLLLLSGLTASYATLISSNVIISAIVEGCKTATNVENIFDGIISDYSCVLEKPTDSQYVSLPILMVCHRLLVYACMHHRQTLTIVSIQNTTQLKDLTKVVVIG